MMSGCRKTKKRKIHFRKATRLLRVPSIVLLDSIIVIRGIKQTNCPLLWDVLEKTDNVRMFDVQITNWYGKDRLEISVLHPKKLEEGLQQRLIWCCQLPWSSFFFLFHPIYPSWNWSIGVSLLCFNTNRISYYSTISFNKPYIFLLIQLQIKPIC